MLQVMNPNSQMWRISAKVTELLGGKARVKSVSAKPLLFYLKEAQHPLAEAENTRGQEQEENTAVCT